METEKDYLYQVAIRDWVENSLGTEIMVPVYGPKNENEYDINPVRFLQKKQNGVMPSNADARLLENLSHQFKLKDEVINIMIEHILNQNDNRLDKNYVEKIAGTWVRNGIDSAEKAFNACRPKERKTTSKKKVERKLPEWYTQEEEDYEAASEEEIAEFKKMLEELEK